MPEPAALWADQEPETPLPLAADLTTDVAVVGAGVAGLTTAYLLARRGHKVVAIDAQGPGAGMTGRSTSHIACGVDEGWRELVKSTGPAQARLVAAAYTAALERIAHIVRDEDIACDFARVDGYLVGRPDERAVLEQELRAATEAGVAGVGWTTAHPFPGCAENIALRFSRQARLHPLKYIKGLASAFALRGGRMVTGAVSRIVELPSSIRVETRSTHTVTARAVVLATNTPLSFKTPERTQELYRSYVIAAPITKALDAVCWDLETPYHYSRIQPGRAGGRDILIVGGEDHLASEAVDAGRYTKLESWARECFPALGAVAARWCGNVKQTADNLAFLGRLAEGSEVYVIDGDGGLGFTHATTGALIIQDQLGGISNPWAEVFSPSRYGPAAHSLLR